MGRKRNHAEEAPADSLPGTDAPDAGNAEQLDNGGSVIQTDNGAAVYVPPERAATAPRSNGQKRVESKADRFRRLANRRVSKALAVLRHVANLGNKAQYEYTEKQADRLISALSEAVSEVKRRFPSTRTADKGFDVSGD